MLDVSCHDCEKSQRCVTYQDAISNFTAAAAEHEALIPVFQIIEVFLEDPRKLYARGSVNSLKLYTQSGGEPAPIRRAIPGLRNYEGIAWLQDLEPNSSHDRDLKHVYGSSPESFLRADSESCSTHRKCTAPIARDDSRDDYQCHRNAWNAGLQTLQ